MVLSHAFEECSFTFSSGENPAPLSRLKSLQLDFFLFKIFLRFYGGEFNQHVFMRWHIINPIGRKNATYCIYHLQSMPSGGKKIYLLLMVQKSGDHQLIWYISPLFIGFHSYIPGISTINSTTFYENQKPHPPPTTITTPPR